MVNNMSCGDDGNHDARNLFYVHNDTLILS